MSRMLVQLKRSSLPVLFILCLAALAAASVYARAEARPLAATTVIGSPDAAVNGKFAVGSASVGTKALTVTGVIDFLGAGTVHNYFSQGGGNNMQINANVDEANTVGDAARSQWKMVMGSSLDQFSIRRSPAGGTYNEDALFFIDGPTGKVGIATVDTGNGATIPFTLSARLHVDTTTDAYAFYTQQRSSAGDTYGTVSFAGSTSGIGIFGGNYNSSGGTRGVWGYSSSTTGKGVVGTASATTGVNYGVVGETASPSGVGVYGSAPGYGIAVYGDNTSTVGWAGYFTGDVWVGGTLYKSAGSFKIDDPLDPAHKYLQHSFVESPDMMNVYNGNVTLNDTGEAVVTLPDWFQAINQDFRYQLTAIGGPGPNLYVADEIQNNKFHIAGGNPGMKVSWMVTGIRHDPYAEAHRIQVVVDKPASEQGTYLFPSLYGQPDSKGLDYAQQSKLSLRNPPEAPQAPAQEPAK
jgi:hypothetical protein